MAITMKGGLPTYFVDQFTTTIAHELQQKESLLTGAVRIEPVMGAEDKSFDMMSSLDLVAKEDRAGATPDTEATTQRRWVEHSPFHQSVKFDPDDGLDMLHDPMGDFNMALVKAVNRKRDEIILAGFDATVKSGRTASTSTITWAASGGNTKYTDSSGGRTIPHDCSEGPCTAAQTGMSVEKATLIREYFAKNLVDPSDPIYCLISPRQATDLFGEVQYSNIDYNTSKPLATGNYIPNWHGINWISHPMVTKGSTNDVDGTTDVYKCWAWAKSGMILGVADNLTVRLSELPDFSYAQQVYVHVNMGVMRFNEDMVLCVECQ